MSELGETRAILTIAAILAQADIGRRRTFLQTGTAGAAIGTTPDSLKSIVPQDAAESAPGTDTKPRADALLLQSSTG